MVFHFREENHVACPNKFSAPCLGYKIDAFRGSTREDDFVSACSADVFCDTLARFFISFRSARTQHVQAAMDVRVFVFVELPKRVDDGPRFLRGRSAIKINQRMAVRLFAENREILTDGAPVYTAGSNLVHTTICSTGRRAPLYSDAVAGCELAPTKQRAATR